jgi:2-polyprenyl-3-methyl-5-hydroxy-6-metoxy-1,4-benzoquinol methylase
MFGADYAHFHRSGYSHGGTVGTEMILKVLAGLEKGMFFDFGCGAGALLAEAVRAGWSAMGYDLDEATAMKYSAETGIAIVSDLHAVPAHWADVIHFGDVLGHLNAISEQFAEALRILRPGGLVIAQGPLEANANFFNWMIRIGGGRRSSGGMPPYHLCLATASGIRQFFLRFDLEQLRFEIREDSHPAPRIIRAKDLADPRKTVLFFIRKISQAISTFAPQKLGNRFFYVGVKSS